MKNSTSPTIKTRSSQKSCSVCGSTIQAPAGTCAPCPNCGSMHGTCG